MGTGEESDGAAPAAPDGDVGQHRQGSRDEYAHPVAPAAGRAEDLQRDPGRAAGGTRYPLHQDQGLPISEIAWHLGYREASAIVAAFRRWTGMPPSQVRRSQAGGSAPSDPPSYREPMDARPGAKQR
ncbi:helix-turn-helix domain-containing protein [Methylorubrum suomiense]